MVSMDEAPDRVIARLLSRKTETAGGCWTFGGKLRPDGYAQVGWSVDGGMYVQGRAHRVMWTYAFGPIPAGMGLDHTCHDPVTCPGGSGCEHRACINPKHLRVATSGENAANRVSSGPRARNLTHCPRGHQFTPENTYVRRSGVRQCRTCDRAAKRLRATQWKGM